MADALEELETLIPQLPSALERRFLGEGLSRVASQLGEITAAAQRLSDIFEIARMIGFGSVPEEVEKMDDLIEDANHLASLLVTADNASALQEIERHIPLFKTTIGNAVTAIKLRWRSQVAAEYRPFQSLGQLLSKIDQTSTLGARMVELNQEAAATLSVTQVDQFKAAIVKLIEKRAQLENEKTSFTADQQVDNFLTGLAQGQAKLRSVSPDVFRWLSEHDALDLFEVRPIA
ncbi:hypothetical protein [Neorhizobium galegae]|uniref:hypothetical protein n=1 Tax=Neorhizobium galegae TaxID=399 RepID=UPI000622363B|nr:hypothetical protein [Neorhizobium galegae]CDZ54377.1 Hypothetical protein NGAL_HAMBI2427_56090 [Neorhizobium galegae bv. orientalis]